MEGEPRRSHEVVSLEEIEAIPGPATLTWRPVRATLGIRAFGTNAYTATEAGVDVVEPHTESLELAHEELYFVARGRARFTIDGNSFEASAGTYVFVPDPRSHRHAIAEEPGTTVLSFGGPPTFKPSAWEWSFRAAALKGSDPAAARRTLEEGFGEWPESPSLYYELACLEATEGNPEAALVALESAIAQEPRIKGDAREDEDLQSLRGLEEFEQLTSE